MISDYLLRKVKNLKIYSGPRVENFGVHVACDIDA